MICSYCEAVGSHQSPVGSRQSSVVSRQSAVGSNQESGKIILLRPRVVICRWWYLSFSLFFMAGRFLLRRAFFIFTVLFVFVVLSGCSLGGSGSLRADVLRANGDAFDVYDCVQLRRNDLFAESEQCFIELAKQTGSELYCGYLEGDVKESCLKSLMEE